MGRIFICFMVAAWCARGGWADELSVATFQADVTPPMGAPLSDGARMPVRKIVDPLSARGVILLGADRPIVLCGVDWIGIGNTAHDAWRKALADAVGTTVDRVAVHCLHQHDAPGCDFLAAEILAEHHLGDAMFDTQFARQAIERTAVAARTSLATARPFNQLGVGQAEVKQVASNRRIIGPDGKVKSMRFSSCREPLVRAEPEGLIDSQVRVVSLWDKDQPLVSLSYYATHPQSFYGRGAVSADFVGLARALRDATLPEVFHVHFNGAGGNLAAGKYNDGLPPRRYELANRLADGLSAAWEATRKSPISPADVAWRLVPVALPLRDLMNEETISAEVANTSLSTYERIRAACDLAWIRRCRAGHKVELSCLKLGEVLIVHMPGELFVEYQLAAAGMRPGNVVCMAAYGDYGPGYIGTQVCYPQGGYECSRVSRTAPEVEPILMQALRELLK